MKISPHHQLKHTLEADLYNLSADIERLIVEVDVNRNVTGISEALIVVFIYRRDCCPSKPTGALIPAGIMQFFSEK